MTQKHRKEMKTENFGHAASKMRHAKLTTTSARKGRLFLTLLMMLLTTASAWAFKAEKTTYMISCVNGQFHIYAGTSETDSWKGTTAGINNVYWKADESHQLANDMTIKPNQNVLYSPATNVGIHTASSGNTEFTFKAPNSIAITNVVFKNGSSVVSSTNSESGSTYTVTLAENTNFNGFEVTFGTISGKCGDNANWALSKQDGQYTKLTISGSGAMTNEYGHETVNGLWRTDAPWGYDLTSVTIENGITSIGQYAFIGCQQLASLTIGSSVTTIGTNAFDHCDKLTEVTLPASVTSIGEQCFKNSSGLQRVNIQHDGAVSLGSNVFQNCGKLQYIVFPNPAAALDNTTGNWSGLASKLRVALGSQLFTVTNQGGTAAYAITNETDLRNLATAINDGSEGITNGKTFRQTGDITLSSTNFDPIGYNDYHYFTGTYDGGGYTISGLNVGDLNYHLNYGLFGYVKNGTVKNVRLINPTVNGDGTSLGAIIGKTNNATVKNCVVFSPTIWGNVDNKGSIIGSNSRSTLENLYYYGGSYGSIGQGGSDTNVTNVGRVRKVILGSGIGSVTPAINPAATSLDNGFVYNDELYYREGLELTLASSLNIPTGYHIVYKAGGNTLTGNTYTVSSTDVTLTAELAYNTYTVQFKANGGSGSMSDQLFTYGTAQDLTANAFNRVGYTFVGWNTQADGNGTSYKDKESVNNLTTTNGGTVNLWAQWTVNTYTVTLNNQSATTAGTASVTATYNAAMPTITVPTKTGYTFGGYFTEANGGGTQYYNADGTSAKNWNLTAATTLYAKWSLDTYTITYNLAGGSVATPNPETYTIESGDITLVNPTRTGYTFAGWTGTDLATPTMSVTISTGSYGDKSYTATWTANTYTITYDLAGGNVATANPETYTIESGDITIVNPTRTGYTFAGWTGTDLASPTMSVTISTGSYGDKSYTATWTANTYTVTLNNQSATTTGSESATATYNAAMPAITVPTKKGYTFGGYYTETNGGGTQYYYADGTSANYWNIAEATTLYAKWTANTYTVKFNGNGGTCGDGEMGDQTFTYDEAQNITANAFTRTGYTFAGWNTQADGNGTSYSDKESVNNLTTENNGTVTLYAKWVVPYIDADGNTQTCSNFTVLTNTTDISNLSAGWYMVTENVSYSKQFNCSKGDIHLILCDGAKMTIESNSSYAIGVSGYSLTIYAQSTGSSMGQLVATTSDKIGIYASGSITICGGNITATSNSSNGIFTTIGNITIHSGQVNASGGIYGIMANSGHNITLGLRNATDFIQVSSYQGTVNIAQGQTLTDGTNFYSGNNVSIPGGKTLRPLVIVTLELSDNADNAEAIGEAAAASTGGSLYNVILSGRTLYKDGDWNTLCLPFALSAEQIAASPLAGATIMELDGTSSDLTNGTLTLNFNDAKEIEAGRPYIVKWPIGRVISSPSDWKSFAADVAGGNTYEGKTVRLAADIEVSEMAGTYTHPFKGTFDGCGHKLTVTLQNNDDSDMGTSEQYQGVAPFRFTQGATIKNLTVDGTVSTTNRKFAAGFIGWALESTNNIQNCTSSVEICSTIDGDGTHGGFVGKASGTLNITNCLFNGMMTTSQTNGTNSCGGFVGWAATANTGVIIKNSLYAPATIPNGKYQISTSSSATFARNGANTNKSYYTETFGTAQGTSTGGATGSALKNLLGDGWEVKDGKAVPVTVSVVADLVNPVFTGVTIDDSYNDVTSKDGKVSFKGTYEGITFDEEDKSILFLGTENTLYYPQQGARIGAQRAYFQLTDPVATVRQFVLNFGEETISSIHNSQFTIHNEAGAWYTVNGVKLSEKPTTKGLYIHGGKKVVIK
jgi:uncharacterized repeat protein (TIGR02543 family)